LKYRVELTLSEITHRFSRPR